MQSSSSVEFATQENKNIFFTENNSFSVYGKNTMEKGMSSISMFVVVIVLSKLKLLWVSQT